MLLSALGSHNEPCLIIASAGHAETIDSHATLDPAGWMRGAILRESSAKSNDSTQLARHFTPRPRKHLCSVPALERCFNRSLNLWFRFIHPGGERLS